MIRGIFRWTLRLFLVLLLVANLVLLAVFSGALYNRFVRFPRETRAIEAIRANRMPVNVKVDWKEYRGVCHNHSELSHDSEVPFTDILAVCKQLGIDAILMSDHIIDGKADYGLQWRGIHDGVLFVPGFEMPYGFMPWGLPETAVLDCRQEEEVLAREIEALGGLLAFAHTEQKRTWDLPQLEAMEIYNLHADFMDENIAKMVPDLLVNLHAYRDLTMRLVFDRQTEILRRWDDLNKTRQITGIAANDAHQNVGVRGYYTEEGRLLLRETGTKTIGEYDLNFATRLLLRLFFGRLEAGKQLFRFEIDPYIQSLRYVNTHFFASELTEEAILDALRAGRVFIGFNMLADSKGFLFYAEDDGVKKIMGESMPFTSTVRLRAASPHACRFSVVHHGQMLYQAEGSEMKWAPPGPGKYRLEAELNILGEWVPWVYTNSLTLLTAAEAAQEKAEAEALDATEIQDEQNAGTQEIQENTASAEAAVEAIEESAETPIEEDEAAAGTETSTE